MCVEKPKHVPLPEQHSLCSKPNSGCCYVEVKTGKKNWEKSLAVLIRDDGEPEAKLFIYTYFLKGIGAGKPLIGQIYSLNKPKELKAKKGSGGDIIMKVITEKRIKLKFKINGKSGGLWVAAVMSGSLNLISHETHKEEKSISASIKTLDSVKKDVESKKTEGSVKIIDDRSNKKTTESRKTLKSNSEENEEKLKSPMKSESVSEDNDVQRSDKN